MGRLGAYNTDSLASSSSASSDKRAHRQRRIVLVKLLSYKRFQVSWLPVPSSQSLRKMPFTQRHTTCPTLHLPLSPNTQRLATEAHHFHHGRSPCCSHTLCGAHFWCHRDRPSLGNCGSQIADARIVQGNFCAYLLAILFPPLAVFFRCGCGSELLISIVLTLIALLPGSICKSTHEPQRGPRS